MSTRRSGALAFFAALTVIAGIAAQYLPLHEPPAPEMPAVVTDPRPLSQLVIYMMEKTGLKFHYEDPVWVHAADAVDTTPWTPGKMRFPGPRINTIQVGSVDFAPLGKSVDATRPLAGRRGASGAEALLHTSGNTVNRVLPEILRPIIDRYNDSPEAPARFQALEKDGAVIVVPVRRRARDGSMEVFQSPLDKEIELPAATQTRNERLAAVCEELSKVSEVPIRFSRGGGPDSGPSPAWPAERATGRDLILRLMAGEQYSSFYGLLCQPILPGADGFCALNIARVLVEVENASGQKVLRQLPTTVHSGLSEEIYEYFFGELAYYQQRAPSTADLDEREFLSNFHSRLLRLKPSRYAEIAAIALRTAATLEELDRKAAEINRAANAQPPERLSLRKKRAETVLEAVEEIRNSGPPPEFVYVDAAIRAHVIAEMKADREMEPRK